MQATDCIRTCVVQTSLADKHRRVVCGTVLPNLHKLRLKIDPKPRSILRPPIPSCVPHRSPRKAMVQSGRAEECMADSWAFGSDADMETSRLANVTMTTTPTTVTDILNLGIGARGIKALGEMRCALRSVHQWIISTLYC